MPGKLKVRIVAGRDLPVMDRASDLTDAFVEIKFGNTTYKTDVYRKSLNPQWNSEWYRFEVDDEDLQDEPLQIRVLDHDTYSAHDAIGKVYIDLNPLLSKDNATVISGWHPIYDTMHGIRGELNVVVKVDLFTDFNKFRQSSCGVQFFCTTGTPAGHYISAIHGFVEELVVNDDPEYQWIDKIRSQRASNEARQIQFSKLSGELQRKIGLKVLEMGGNSVIAYRQCFDLEGESGIVVRAIGTSVTVVKLACTTSPNSVSPGKDINLAVPSIVIDTTLPRYSYGSPPALLSNLVPPSGTNSRRHSQLGLIAEFASSYPLPEDCTTTHSPTPITPTKLSASPTKTGMPLARRSSESDVSTPPKGNSLTGSSGSGGCGSGAKTPFHRPVLQQESIEMMEYPFFTMRVFPPGFLVHLGGVVSARSVKLLDRIHNPDEPETRDAWWTEIRTEIRSHARAMGCHAVIGYSEHTTICDEIIVLSATGTAATVNLRLDPELLAKQSVLTMSVDRPHFEKEKEREIGKDKKLHVDINLANQVAHQRMHHMSDSSDEGNPMLFLNCRCCHIPYNEASAPIPVNLTKCAICRRHKVPDVLFTTVEPPAELAVVGKGCLIQARICRPKKEAKGETNAKEISDNLPFMEYELHNQLLNKLKIKGMNGLFCLKIQVAVGQRLLVALATGTALYCAPLPAPPVPRLCAKDTSMADSYLQDMQRKVLDTVNKNKDIYGLYPLDYGSLDQQSPRGNLTDESEDELGDLDLSSGNKDTFVLEIDDAEDAAVVSVMLEPPMPEGFDMCNTEAVPGVPNLACNLQMLTKVWRGHLSQNNNKEFSSVMDSILKSVMFKLRAMTPCCISRMDFDIHLHDEGEVQVTVIGMAVGVGEPPVNTGGGLMEIASEARAVASKQGGQIPSQDQDDMMFHMEEVLDTNAPQPLPATLSTPQLHTRAPRVVKSERKIKYHTAPKYRYGIELTPLSYIPKARMDRYLGNLNFFLIRESTSVREDGGLNGFMHNFLVEVIAICRAHVVALGGNAMVAYQLTECILDDNPHKNQSQCLVNVSGDVVFVQYEVDLHLPSKAGSVSPRVLDQKSAKKTTPKNSPKHSPKEQRALSR